MADQEYFLIIFQPEVSDQCIQIVNHDLNIIKVAGIDALRQAGAPLVIEYDKEPIIGKCLCLQQ